MKRAKRFLNLALSLALLVPSGSALAASSGTENFYKQLSSLTSSRDSSHYFGEMNLTIGSNILNVDGEERKMDSAPEIVADRTMLPIRAIAEAAGASIGWDADTRSVTITSQDGDTVACSIGSDILRINGVESKLDVVPYINTKNNRTYLPVRAVTEAPEVRRIVFVEPSHSTPRPSAPATARTGM